MKSNPRNSGAKTHEVGSKQPNAWGLYDTLGNVWEWVFDWFAPYAEGAATDPRGPATGQFRVRRGGASGSLAGLERVSLRGGNVGAIIGIRRAGNRTLSAKQFFQFADNAALLLGLLQYPFNQLCCFSAATLNGALEGLCPHLDAVNVALGGKTPPAPTEY